MPALLLWLFSFYVFYLFHPREKTKKTHFEPVGILALNSFKSAKKCDPSGVWGGGGNDVRLFCLPCDRAALHTSKHTHTVITQSAVSITSIRECISSFLLGLKRIQFS